MSDIREIVDSLEIKFQKFIHKMNDLQAENHKLIGKLLEYEQEILNQKKEISLLEENLNSLKITNSLLGSDKYKKDTKFKINSLIKEIDYCITQLSD